MKCPKCRAKISELDEICPKCKTNLEEYEARTGYEYEAEEVDETDYEQAYEGETSEEKNQANSNNSDIIYSTTLNHINGLPLAENSECVIFLCKDGIKIEGTKNIYKLKNSKILDMNIKTSEEIKNSISGATGGTMLFGTLGSFLFGSSKELHRFLLIVYESKDGEEQCISLDIGDNLKKYKEIYRYVQRYKEAQEPIEQKEEIEL